MNLTIFMVAAIVILNVSTCSCAKILGIFPSGARSHSLLGNTYLRALADAGHNVTMVSPYEDKNPVKNGSYRNILLTNMIEKHQAISNTFFDKPSYNPFNTILVGLNFFTTELEKLLEQPAIQNLIHSNETYDIVVVNQFFYEGLKMFAHHFNAHLIVFQIGPPSYWINNLVSNPSPISYIPEPWLGVPSEMTLWQKFKNALFSWYIELLLYMYLIPSQNKIVQKHFPDSPQLKEVLHNTSLVLVNSHESVNEPVPFVPAMIPIGGFHLRNPKPLPNDLQEFLDDAKEGVIYFSMGSNLRSTDIPIVQREIFLRTFAKLKHKVLWKYENDELPGKPDNVKISKWLPQNDILAHPNIKVFISQGGYLSTTEAVYHGVPIIAIPIISDQRMNANNAASLGYCVVLQFSKLSEESLTEALNEALFNPKYSKNVKKKSKILRDRPMNPVDTAIWWTEYVLRHNGAKHLRVAGLNLPWYSFYSIDILIITILLVAIILCTSLKLIYSITKFIKTFNCSKVKIN